MTLRAQLERLKELREKATQGEWGVYEDVCRVHGSKEINNVPATFSYKTASLTKGRDHNADAGDFYNPADAEYIAAAANLDLSALLAMVERLEKAEETLRFYADTEKYDMISDDVTGLTYAEIEVDEGQRARDHFGEFGE